MGIRSCQREFLGLFATRDGRQPLGKKQRVVGVFLAPLVQEQYWKKQRSKHKWEMRPFPTVLAQGEEGEDFRAVLWQVSVCGECWHARSGRVCRRWRHPGFSQFVPSCSLATCSASPAESHCLCFHQFTNLARRRQLPAATRQCSLLVLWEPRAVMEAEAGPAEVGLARRQGVLARTWCSFLQVVVILLY